MLTDQKPEKEMIYGREGVPLGFVAEKSTKNLVLFSDFSMMPSAGIIILIISSTGISLFCSATFDIFRGY